MYAAYIHRALPQRAKGGKSPYEITTGRPPDDDVLFIHVFGCPCQYEPAYGVEHKRSAKTEWGWFVGLQWPMVLVLRPEDNKVLSISRKKVYCHELMYARYDATTMDRPRIEFRDFTLHACEIDDAIQMAKLEDEKSMMENAKDDKTSIEQMKERNIHHHEQQFLLLSMLRLDDQKITLRRDK